MPRCLIIRRCFGIGIKSKMQLMSDKKIVQTDKQKFDINTEISYVKLTKKPLIVVHSKRSDKIPICTRFHMNYLTKKCFIGSFIETMKYDYATNLSFKLIKAVSNYNTIDIPLEEIKGCLHKKPSNKNVFKFKTVDSKLNKLKTKTKSESDKFNFLQKSQLIKSIFRVDENVDLSKMKHVNSDTLKSVEKYSNKAPTSRSVKEYHCYICWKVFHNTWTLKVHLRQHTGEKPFACDFENCSKSYADCSNLRAHQRDSGHHNWKWACPVCKKPFSQKVYLKRHTIDGCVSFSLRNSPKS